MKNNYLVLKNEDFIEVTKFETKHYKSFKKCKKAKILLDSDLENEINERIKHQNIYKIEIELEFRDLNFKQMLSMFEKAKYSNHKLYIEDDKNEYRILLVEMYELLNFMNPEKDRVLIKIYAKQLQGLD